MEKREDNNINAGDVAGTGEVPAGNGNALDRRTFLKTAAAAATAVTAAGHAAASGAPDTKAAKTAAMGTHAKPAQPILCRCRFRQQWSP